MGYAGGQFAVCLLCSAFTCSRCKSTVGQGGGGFRRRENFVRYAQSEGRQAAEAVRQERVRVGGAH
eukprot:7332901-Pyramimonas_sp.AAC.1